MEQIVDILKPGSGLPQRDLPNATTSSVLGIISIVGFFSLGFIGLVCGIIGLVLANKDRKLYQASPETYTMSSFKTLNSGRTCSIIGLCISAIAIIVFCLIVLG
ncbi:MAG: CCC motif membrane protein [Ginsengibacter sp.]